MSAQSPISPDAARRRGRGAVSNRDGRYERFSHEAEPDGWPGDGEVLPPFRTDVSLESARSAISWNSSPDLPFDRSVNPYRGCEHGCVYCFARPGHAWLGMSPGLDFETRLIARPNIPDVLLRELGGRRYLPDTIAIGTYTDPYQPIEAKHEIMRRVLQVLDRCNHPVAIVTKGTLIERDIDILAPMAARGLVRVGVSVTTLDRHLARKMEPRVPTPERRLAVIRRLSGAGIPVRVMASPLVPGLSDQELERILEAGKTAGACSASWIMLRLPQEVSLLFQEWLAEHYPNRAARVMARLREMHGGRDYDPQWGRRMRGKGTYAEMVARRFGVAVRRLGLQADLPPLRCDLFTPPGGRQLSLF